MGVLLGLAVTGTLLAVIFIWIQIMPNPEVVKVVKKDEEKEKEEEVEDKPQSVTGKIIEKFDDAIELGPDHWVSDPTTGWTCVYPQYSSITFKCTGYQTGRPYAYFVAGNDITNIIPEDVDGDVVELIRLKYEADEKTRLDFILWAVEGASVTAPKASVAIQPSLAGYRLYNAIRSALGKQGWVLCDDATFIQYADTSLQVRCISPNRMDAFMQKTYLSPFLTAEQQAELAKIVWKVWNSLPETNAKIELLVNYAETISE